MGRGRAGLARGRHRGQSHADLEPEVRDLIAGLEDRDPDDFEIAWHYRQGERDPSPVVDELRQREATAAEAVLSRDRARLEAIRQ
ncbi:hypothetical protein FHU38_003592 [Saccharomonospora amisosensis]|uniref:Uncharacterized protein n=1 Tax=Saccharomonospora amisosensis TaxID=1128677 RepID=A0A7X5US95_9PSEU|nr:hypothetical protein [Saccharomonospora amisosensis]NIJ13248.1 hypothetical protein [Saccharomonospora amisosensis]